MEVPMFGYCPKCADDNKLIPIYFIEHEYIKGKKTGRIRRAVSHLECAVCGRSFTIDDSFDALWHYENQEWGK